MSDSSPDLTQYVQWCRDTAAHLRRHPHIDAADLTAIQSRLYYDGLRVLPVDLARTLPAVGPLTEGFARLDHLGAIATGRPPRRYYDVLAALERVIDWHDTPTAGDGDDAAEVPPVIAAALDIIRRAGGITAKGIVARLRKQGHHISYDTFRRHHVPTLKRLGVRNDRSRGGYYLPDGM